MSELKKTLSLYAGTALFLNIVIGAGLLVLPGLVYKQVGSMSMLSWLACAVVALPLLIVFMVLGKHYPDSGGIAHYALRAFGKLAQKIAAFLFLGAIVFGLPSIAMTGGYYLNAVAPLPVHFYAVLFVILPALLHGISGNLVSKILGVIGSSVILILMFLLAVSVAGLDSAHLNKPLIDHGNDLDLKSLPFIFSPFMMIFFAFTGWEVGSHAAEEFKNPRRDFPLAMLFSFVIATAFYLCIAWVVQKANLQEGFEAPFVEITRPVLGENGKYLVAIVAAALIFANLFGAIWGVSRLVYSLGRDGIIHKSMATTRAGTPLSATFVVVLCLLAMIGLDFFQVVDIKAMLALAGQNFLILYGIAGAALFALTKSMLLRFLSILVIGLTGVILYIAGVHLIYPAGLVVFASLIHALGSSLAAPGKRNEA